MDKINNWIQLVGMLAVVASLIFVGLQLKQSQEIAIAAQYQDRFDTATNHYTSILQSDPSLRVMGGDVVADMLAKDTTSPEIKEWAAAQPPEEIAFRVIGAIIFLKSHDNIHFQYQSGFLSEEAWLALRSQLKAGLWDKNSWMQGIYMENKSVWRKSYQKVIEELLEEGPDS